MTSARTVEILAPGDVFRHPIVGDDSMLVRVTSPARSDHGFVGYDGTTRTVILIDVEVLEVTGDFFEVGQHATLTYTPGAEVLLAEAPSQRSYVIGLPVIVTVHDDGRVEFATDLAEVTDDVDSDEITEDDILTVTKAARSLGCLIQTTVHPEA